jgi:hypothetical protein
MAVSGSRQPPPHQVIKELNHADARTINFNDRDSTAVQALTKLSRVPRFVPTAKVAIIAPPAMLASVHVAFLRDASLCTAFSLPQLANQS